MTGKQMGRHLKRQSFVERQFDDHRHFETGHSVEGGEYENGEMSRSRRWRFEYRVSVEGNDVASRLQWRSYSKMESD